MQERVQRFNKGSYKIVANAIEEGSYMEKFYKKNLSNSTLYRELRLVNTALEIACVFWSGWCILDIIKLVSKAPIVSSNRLLFLVTNVIVFSIVFTVCVCFEDTILDKELASQVNVEKAKEIMVLSEWLKGTDINSYTMTVRDETYSPFQHTVKVGFTNPDTRECRDVTLTCIVDSKVSSPILNMCKGTITLKEVNPYKVEVGAYGENVKK